MSTMRKSSTSKASGIPVSSSVLRQRNQSDTPVLNRLSGAKHGHESNQKNKLQPNVKRKRSSAELLSRVSLATGRSTPNKFVTPNQNRLLAVPSAQFSRNSVDTVRSSFGGKQGSLTWPLNELSFKKELIEKAVLFIDNYPGDFSVKDAKQMMKSPNGNDFIKVFSYIYGHLCSGYHMASTRTNEEVPQVLKKLKYPLQIQKSSFKAVGVAHTWPPILAMLGWQIDLVTLFNEFEPVNLIAHDDFEEESNVYQKRFTTIVDIFHEGANESAIEEHLVKYKEALENEDKVTDQEFQKYDQELKGLKLRLESMESSSNDMQSDEEKLKILRKDYSSLSKHNDKMKVHMGEKDRERARIDAKLDELREENEQIKEQIHTLEEIKSNQKLSTAELNAYRYQKQDLEAQTNHYQMEEKNLNEQIDAVQMSDGKLQMRLSKLSIQFNDLAEKQQLPLEGISICDLEEQVQGWRTDVVDVIKNEKAKIKDKNFAIRNYLLESKAQLGKVQAQLNDRECEHHKAECNQKRLEGEIKSLRKEIDQSKKSHAAELDSLADQISQERMVSKMSLPQLQSRLQDAEKELEDYKRKDRENKEKNAAVLERVRLEMKDALKSRRENLDTLNHNLNAMGVEVVKKCKSMVEEI